MRSTRSGRSNTGPHTGAPPGDHRVAVKPITGGLSRNSSQNGLPRSAGSREMSSQPGVVQEVHGDDQVHRTFRLVFGRIGADVAAPERVLPFLPLGQPNHFSGDIHSCHIVGAGNPEQSGVEPLPAREVQYAQPANVTEGLEERVALDVPPERKLLRILIGGGDRVVLRHAYEHIGGRAG